MNAAAAQVVISPPPGARLAGFMADRFAENVLDDLYCRALLLETASARLLWLHLDLIALDHATVTSLREGLTDTLGLALHEVMFSCTHTHSGPGTVRLNRAGGFDEAYLARLEGWVLQAARDALARPAEVELLIAQGQVDLAVDRRHDGHASPDPVSTVAGLRKPTGEYLAVLTNYPMHPVLLGYQNRRISADWPGALAAELAARLPGRPMVLATNGACGELNPPSLGADPEPMRHHGRALAEHFAALLASAEPSPEPPLTVARMVMQVQLDAMSAEQIDARAAEIEHDEQLTPALYRAAVADWREAMHRSLAEAAPPTVPMELMAVRLGPLRCFAIAAECFTAFTRELRRSCPGPLCTIGYANGCIGYLPDEAAYAEGGYEVDQAYLFYNSFRPKPDQLQRAVDEARRLASITPATE